MPVIGVIVNYHLMFQNSSFQPLQNLLDYLGDNRVRRTSGFLSVFACASSGQFGRSTHASGSGVKNLLPMRRRFNAWVRRIPWRRKCQPTVVFLPR